MIKNNWFLPVLLSVISVIAVLSSVDREMWNTDVIRSHSVGVTAIVLMAVSCILAARLTVFEKIFGGMDRVYSQHKWLGIMSLVFVGYHLHESAKFTRGSPWERSEVFHTWHLTGGSNIPNLLESLALIGLTIIVVTALNRNIRYSLWRWIHKASGFVMIIAATHALTTGSIFPIKSPAGIWLSLWVVPGAIAFIYRLFFYDWVNPGKPYKVTSVERSPRGVAIDIEPIKKSVTYQPGSFAFLSFEKKGMREPHPFSIATSPKEDGSLSFLIRCEGDFTRKLRKEIAVGDGLRVRGPYGKFHRNNKSNNASEIWVAGGVGIAPFVSWLENMNETPANPVHLYYSYREGDSVIDSEKLRALAESKGVQFTALCSTHGETLGLDHIKAAETEGVDNKNIQAYYCGPEGLHQAFKGLLQKAGVPANRLKTELFNFR